jgi:purine-binding chemotaxis protein CheW
MDLPDPHTQILEQTDATPAAGHPSRVCLITLSGGTFALDLRGVREVFPIESITPVPGMPSVLVGVTNLRGVVLPIVDVRSVLGLTTVGPLPKFVVVLAHGRNQVGVLVDRVPEIKTVEQDQFLSATEAGEAEVRPFVSTILRVEDRLGGLLEVPTLLAYMDAAGVPKGNT